VNTLPFLTLRNSIDDDKEAGKSAIRSVSSTAEPGRGPPDRAQNEEPQGDLSSYGHAGAQQPRPSFHSTKLLKETQHLRREQERDERLRHNRETESVHSLQYDSKLSHQIVRTQYLYRLWTKNC